MGHYFLDTQYISLREAAKKDLFFLVAWQLRGGGGEGLATNKKYFFLNSMKIVLPGKIFNSVSGFYRFSFFRF